MNRPTWATVISVLGIIFSLFGMLGAGQDVAMPMMMKFQKQMISQFQEIQEKQMQRKGSESDAEEFNQVKETMEKIWRTPEWFGTFSVMTGILKLLICGFGLFAYITLLQVKPHAIKLVYWAISLAIGLTVLKGAISVASMSIMAMVMGFGSAFGVVVNIVLLIVVAVSDKSDYYHAAHHGTGQAGA